MCAPGGFWKMNQAGNEILYSPHVLLAAGMMWCTCSLATRVGHRRLPSSRTSTPTKIKQKTTTHIFKIHTLTQLLTGVYGNFSGVNSWIIFCRKPTRLISPTWNLPPWTHQAVFLGAFHFLFYFPPNFTTGLCTNWSTDEGFHVPSLLGLLAKWLPPRALAPTPSRTEHCTLLEQHSSCHCTLMDRWWLRPSAQPDGDTEGNWGGGGGVHLTFETADGCAKESEDIQLIKPKLRWVRRCRMGGLGGADFFEEELGLMGGKSLESRGLERGRAMEMSPFHTNSSKWWIVAHKDAVSFRQNVLIMNFRPTRTPEDHAVLELIQSVLKLVPQFH